VEPLRQFLLDNLAENPTQGDAEGDNIIVDAIVIYRIQGIGENDGPGNELYKYTVTTGVNMAMAFGMMQIAAERISHVYHIILDQAEEDDDGETE
jgi:hypothetical protein